MKNKRNTLIVIRLFSGLVSSVVNKNWRPTGIPAIYKIIEGMNNSGIKTDVLFLCKTDLESKNILNTESFRLEQDQVKNINFHIVAFRNTKINSAKFNLLYNDFFHLIYFIKLILQRKYEVVYCDRTNVFFGAVAAVLLRKKVFLRLLGFYPDMKKLFTDLKYKIFYPITYLSYFAPFTLITCTQDDSGGRYYLSRLPSPDTSKKILLNGVDYKKSTPIEIEQLRNKYELKSNAPIFLYVGKLEKEKGCIEFVETMINIKNKGYKIYAIIIGAGPMSGKIEKIIKDKNIDDVIKFVGPVPSNKIYHYYNLADIYVHLYIWASMTNTVLESMAAGNVLVLISPSTEEHIGEYAEEIIPNDCAIRFNRDRIVPDLTEKLTNLLDDPLKIKDFKAKMANLAPKILSSWEQRINYEIGLIKKSVSKEEN
jgi:glycosyltransferase involved in cell wall biosynthesis